MLFPANHILKVCLSVHLLLPRGLLGEGFSLLGLPVNKICMCYELHIVMHNRNLPKTVSLKEFHFSFLNVLFWS